MSRVTSLRLPRISPPKNPAILPGLGGHLRRNTHLDYADHLRYDKDGKITKESGLQMCDKIREDMRPFCANINKKNIAFAVVEINGERHVLVAIHGSDAKAPGTLAKPDAQEVFKPSMNPAYPRNADSENKILEPVGQVLLDNPNAKGTIKLFSEQDPCSVSCKPIIEGQYVQRGFQERVPMTVSSVYRSRQEREDAVLHRVKAFQESKRNEK
jgi:hypothetical protein